ncbi:4Fe-4S dicluster domain-containing protein, partial [bacterium]|nr:4Fe-4S dicluster domain-containing protein [bacterium]
CKGCGYCVEFCPKGVLSLSEDRFNAKGYYYAEMRDASQCVGCGLCAMYCPDFAIYLLDDSGNFATACQIMPEWRLNA